MSFKTDLPCTACSTVYFQRCFHHIKRRAAGGSNESHNMMPLCLGHHTQIHLIGEKEMSKLFPSVGEWLATNGWSFDEMFNYWYHPNEA